MTLRGLVALPALAAGAEARPRAQAPVPATAAAAALDSRAVVAEVRRIIAERYVLPERRPALDAILARGLASGRYDVREPALLAERINADLDTAGHDRHLNFNFNPRQAEHAGGGASVRQPDNSALSSAQARAANHGVTASGAARQRPLHGV